MNLTDFIRESNAIEGIHRDPLPREIKATTTFLARNELSIGDLSELVRAYAPGNRLRDQVGLNVRVGNHIAPAGGPKIPYRLDDLLYRAQLDESDPWVIHCEYEDLHPFTDGNGRSGRALWLWMMQRRGGTGLGFKHAWYYQTLDHWREFRDVAAKLEAEKARRVDDEVNL